MKTEQFNDYQLGIVDVDEEKKKIIITHIGDETTKRLLEITNGGEGWEIHYDPIYEEKQLCQGIKEAAAKIIEKHNNSFFGRLLNWIGI